MISSVFVLAETVEEQIKALQDAQRLDSQILTEQFYFWTVVVMWLIHAGFMAYEAGVCRRKNIMSTAMKNILTIAVVTPTFYYFGWYIYGCMEEGWPKNGHDSPDAFPGFCGLTAPWSEGMGPNLQDHVSLVFFLAFLLFSWTTASIMSGALIERVRLSAFLLLAVMLGSVVWILDAAWGWSSGGWLTTRFGFHDSIASGRRARRRRRLHARRAAEPRPADRQVRRRRPRADLQTPQHAHDVDGADADLHGLLRVLRRVPGDPVDDLPGLAQHLPLPDDARHDRDGDHLRLRRRLHGRLVRLEGRPVLDALRRSRGRDLGVRGRRRLPPVARLPPLVHRRHDRASGSGTGSRRSSGSTTPSVPSRCTASAASTASSSSGSSPAATRPGSTTSRARSAAS